MEQEPLKNSTAAQRKMKFAPKAPPRRIPKPEVKTEVAEDADAAQARDLLKRFNESNLKAKQKVGRKVAPTQVAFGSGGTSTSIRSYGIPKAGNSSTRYEDGALPSSTSKEYVEPWDYYSYYPVTLPLRRPYTGNPDLLNEEEFGEASDTFAYNENTTNPAIDLGLMEENPETNIIFLQLPPMVPVIKRSATVDTMEAADSLQQSKGSQPENSCTLNELAAGSMGKLLVYRSGAVKLKLGDIVYDVSSGMDCGFAQDVAAINLEEKHCCIVGELSKRAILTPDVGSILKNIEDL